MSTSRSLKFRRRVSNRFLNIAIVCNLFPCFSPGVDYFMKFYNPDEKNKTPLKSRVVVILRTRKYCLGMARDLSGHLNGWLVLKRKRKSDPGSGSEG